MLIALIWRMFKEHCRFKKVFSGHSGIRTNFPDATDRKFENCLPVLDNTLYHERKESRVLYESENMAGTQKWGDDDKKEFDWRETRRHKTIKVACDVCGLRRGASGQRMAQPVRQTAHKHSGKGMGSRPQGYTPQPPRIAWSGERLATRSNSPTNIMASALPDLVV